MYCMEYCWIEQRVDVILTSSLISDFMELERRISKADFCRRLDWIIWFIAMPMVGGWWNDVIWSPDWMYCG
jgi:hypothetical protein